MDSGKSLSVQSGCFPFQNHDQNCSRIHESLAVCERATAATVNVLQPLCDERFSLSRMDAALKMMPLPLRKSYFYLQTIHFQLEIFCSRSLKNLKKNMSLSFHFCSHGKDVSFSFRMTCTYRNPRFGNDSDSLKDQERN